MKTIAIEAPPHQPDADAPHEVLIRLQSEVDEALALSNAQADAEARQRAAAQKAAKSVPQTRVRFAYD